MVKMHTIFIYHKGDEVTHKNWASLLKHGNIGTPVSDDINVIPGTWTMNMHKKFVPDRDKYWNCDTKVYNWAIHNKGAFKSKDWHCIMEWDTRVETKLSEYLNPFMNSENCVWASEVFKRSDDPHWMWWGMKPKRVQLMGIRPFSMIAIQHGVLLEIAYKAWRDVRFHDFMNNECRFGSLVAELGIDAREYPDHISKCITWTSRTDTCSPVSHPVKTA